MKRKITAILIILLLMLGGCALQGERPFPAMSADGVHPRLIAHAGGAIYGYRLTNSLEAITTAAGNGFGFIELDFDVTSDGQIVLIHAWKGVAERLLGSKGKKTLQEFLEAETLADLTLMDLSMLSDWLKDHPQVSIITDVKAEDNVAVLKQLMQQADASRFIPQAYSEEEYRQIKALGYERVILTAYRMEVDADALSEFAQKERPWAITVHEQYISAPLLNAISETDTAIYAHTVNSVDFYEKWKDQGLTGIYTDYFEPSNWLYK